MAGGTPATTGGVSTRRHIWNNLTSTKPRAIATTIVALGLLQACTGKLDDVLYQTGQGAGEVVGGALGIPIRAIGGGAKGVIRTGGDVARDLSDEVDFGGTGEWAYPTATPDSESTGPSSPGVPDGGGSKPTGEVVTKQDTIDIFDITRADGSQIGPNELKKCPGEPEGTCYKVYEQVDITIPSGAVKDAIDGNLGGKTYLDDAEANAVVGFDELTLRPGLLEGY